MAMTTQSTKVPDFYTKADFDADLRNFYGQLKDTAEKEDEAMPVMFVKMATTWPPKPDDEGKLWELAIMAFAGGLEDYDQKIKTFTGAGMKFGQERKMIIAAFFGCEAWMAGEKYDENGDMIQPSKQVDRQECVMLSGMSIDGKVAAITAPIRRAKESTARFVGAETVMDEKGQENNLLKAFFKGYAMGTFSPKKGSV